MARPRRSAEGLRPGPLLNLFTASQLANALVQRELEAVGLRSYWLGVLHLIWLNEPVAPTTLEALSGRSTARETAAPPPSGTSGAESLGGTVASKGIVRRPCVNGAA